MRKLGLKKAIIFVPSLRSPEFYFLCFFQYMALKKIVFSNKQTNNNETSCRFFFFLPWRWANSFLLEPFNLYDSMKEGGKCSISSKEGGTECHRWEEGEICASITLAFLSQLSIPFLAPNLWPFFLQALLLISHRHTLQNLPGRDSLSFSHSSLNLVHYRDIF